MTVFKVGNQFNTKYYKKPSKQNYLHGKSEHPRSMNNSIAFSQASCWNQICYNKIDLQINTAKSH